MFSIVFSPEFRCPETKGFFRDPLLCYKFYECVGGVRHELYCPRGSVFSEARGFCDAPGRVPSCSRVQRRRRVRKKK